MKKILLMTVLAMLVVAPAFAEPSPAEPSSYIQLKLGVFSPQSDDFDALNFDDEFYGELGLGFYVNRNLAIDFGVGYTKPGGETSLLGSPMTLDITIIPLTLGIRAILPVGAAELYAAGGMGIFFTKAEDSMSVPGEAGNHVLSHDTDEALGFYLGLGANFNVSRNVFLGLEGRYYKAADATFDTTAGTEWHLEIDGILATANIGYRF